MMACTVLLPSRAPTLVVRDGGRRGYSVRCEFGRDALVAPAETAQREHVPHHAGVLGMRLDVR
jgi:hypothetical protein